MTTVVALFHSQQNARDAVNTLVEEGFDAAQISFVTGNESGLATRQSGDTIRTDAVTAGEGAGFGATVGALTGILAGLTTLVVPVLGPVVVAGPLLGGLVGAVAGAATGGIAAALIKTGVSEEEANAYTEGVRRGETLVTVDTTDDRVSAAKDILRTNGGYDLHERDSLGTNGNHAYPNVDDDTTTRMDKSEGFSDQGGFRDIGDYQFADLEPDFQAHFAANYGNMGLGFADYTAAYRYGYDLARHPNYAEYDWEKVERPAGASWDAANPKRPWRDFSVAAQYAWDRVRRGY